MLRLAAAFLLALTALANAQQLTATSGGTLPLDAYGYHIFTSTPGVSGSCAAKNYTASDGSPATCFVKVSSSVGNDSTCGAYSVYSDNDSTDIPCATFAVALGKLATKSNHPDWILTKKGDTFSDTFITAGLCTSGYSATRPLLFTTYPTSATGAKPVITNVTVNRAMITTSGGGGCGPYADYWALVGYNSYDYANDPANGGTGAGQNYGLNITNPFNWVLIEDNVFNFWNLGLDISTTPVSAPSGTLVLNRNVITNNYASSGNSAGALIFSVGNISINGNVFANNGWNAAGGTVTSALDHNLYDQYGNGPSTIQQNIFAYGASGEQVRSGGIQYDNLFMAESVGTNSFLIKSIISYNVFTEVPTNGPVSPITADGIQATSAVNGPSATVATSAPSNAGDLTLHFNADFPTSILTGTQIAIDVTQGETGQPGDAGPLGFYNTINTATSSTVTMKNALVGPVAAGDTIVFIQPALGGVPVSGSSVGTSLVNNILTNSTPSGGTNFGLGWPAGTSGGVASSNVACKWGTSGTASNLYRDQGSNQSQATAGTFQQANCNGIGPDPANATMSAYATYVGLTASAAAFLTCAENMSRDNWISGTFNQLCMAHPVDNFIRGKLGVPVN